MNVRKFLILFLLLVVFVQLCNAGKKNKEEKEPKEKDKNVKEPKEEKEKEKGKEEEQEKEVKVKKEKEPKEKNKDKGKDKKDKKDKESKKDKASKKDKKDKEKGGLTTSEVVEDKEYWSSEDAHRTWSENDNPLKSNEILRITAEMKEFVERYGETITFEDENIFEIIEGIFKIQEQYIDLGMPVAYLFGDNSGSANAKLFPISTILGAVVDTKHGEDLPPILTSACSLEKCMDTTYQWVINEEEKVGATDIASNSQPGIIENIQEGFLSTFTQLSQTFSKKDTQAILCARSKSITTTKLTLAAELVIIEEETKNFLKEPERFSKEFAEVKLKKSYDRVRAKMLLKMIEGLCG